MCTGSTLHCSRGIVQPGYRHRIMVAAPEKYPQTLQFPSSVDSMNSGAGPLCLGIVIGSCSPSLFKKPKLILITWEIPLLSSRCVKKNWKVDAIWRNIVIMDSVNFICLQFMKSEG